MNGILDWYLLGVAAGFGVAAGIAAARSGERRPPVLLASVALGVAVGLIALFATGWAILAGIVGLLLAASFLRGLSREAVLAALLATAALAVVPALGYVEAVATPFLGARLRRRTGKRYAGLRILAKD